MMKPGSWMRVDALGCKDLLAVAWISEAAKEDRNNKRGGRPKGHLGTRFG